MIEKKDFTYTKNSTGDYRDTWRIFRIMSEFVEGYSFLTTLKKTITFMGSARIAESSPLYQAAHQLGLRLGKEGYTVVTGGGAGIMEAGNRGAFEAGGESVGLNIQLPFEQRINKYVTKSTAFYYFFTRKVMLTSPADAFIFFPGGFGTMDEFFEVVDHMETGKMCQVPIVLFDSAYWNPLLHFLRNNCSTLGSVNIEQIDKWIVVDTVEEAFDAIHNNHAAYGSCDLSPMNFHNLNKDVDWRIFRIMAELVEGFDFLTGLVEDVTILGSRSITQDSPYYLAAYTLAVELAEKNMSIVTGGGSGIAEAANKGAFEMGAPSYGIGMEVRGKTQMNSYVQKGISFTFPFTRKMIVTAPSKAFVFFPCGFGSLHQLFEVLTLIQTKKMDAVPIILYDRHFWQPLNEYIKSIFIRDYKTINSPDDELYQIVDAEKSAANIIVEARKGTLYHL